MIKTRTFGLVGKSLKHSFSKQYFEDKFERFSIKNTYYENFELEDISKITTILNPFLKGFNVTIPYKEAIIPYLSELDPVSKTIGAVNTVVVKFSETEVSLKGYNTDAFGFRKSIKPFLRGHHNKALILGTGGASRAVAYVLSELQIDSNFITRNPTESNEFGWDQVNEMMIKHHPLIINTTPLGMFPNSTEFPALPYEFIGDSHFAIDLIYNPGKTEFLQRAEKQGAIILNGGSMLKYQAEKSWEIWNKAQ